MTTISLDATQALTLLRRAVDGKEYFVYMAPFAGAACVYQHNDRPSCLIGHALVLAGASITQLAELDDNLNDNGSGIAHVMAPWLLLTDNARKVFATAQEIQDQGAAWGVVLDWTETLYEVPRDE